MLQLHPLQRRRTSRVIGISFPSPATLLVATADDGVALLSLDGLRGTRPGAPHRGPPGEHRVPRLLRHA